MYELQKTKFKSMKKHSRGGYKIFLNTFQIFLICLSHLHITFQVIFFSSRIKVANPEPILPPPFHVANQNTVFALYCPLGTASNITIC